MIKQTGKEEGFSYVDLVFPIPLKRTFTYRAPQHCSVGMRVQAELRKKIRIGIIVGVQKECTLQDVKDIVKCIDTIPLFSRDYLRMAEKVAEFYFASLGECLFTMLPVHHVKREVSLVKRKNVPESGWHLLSAEQEEALATIMQDGERPVYVQGITGSGKTEVYLRAAQQMLAKGKGVIYLVPEIALSYQLIADIQNRFSEQSAVLHSGISNVQKLAQWRAIFNGNIKLVVGTRSAVFAPVKNLGLIIVDEEHDSSYKSSQTPRYHARQVALMRCRMEGGRLVMGSATPSMEAWQRMECRDLERVSLRTRVAGGGFPEIELVHMSREKRMLSSCLVNAVSDTVNAGSQAVLFLNRRGFAHLFFCKSCGESMRCVRCSVYMTYHKNMNAMLCHYCGYTCVPQKVCEHCSSLDVGYVSFGTQKLEEDVKNFFPDYRIARLDSDAAQKRGYAEEVLKDFRNRKYDILIGTQMIAKGLNIPGVALVGIVLADTALSLPDFRASERTFSQIVQVSGRASRFSPGGRVIVQALRSEHESIQCASRMQLEEFYASELKTRSLAAFPPFTRIVRLVCRGRKKKLVEKNITSIATRAETLLSENIRMVGPAECYISIVAGKYRMHLVFYSAQVRNLHSCIRSLLETVHIDAQVYLEVDVDPLFIA